MIMPVQIFTVCGVEQGTIFKKWLSAQCEDDILYQGHKKTPIKYSWCGSESSCFQQGEGASPKDANIDIDAWM